MLLGVIACVSLFSLLLSLWTFIDSREKPKKSELGPLLLKSAEELSKNFERQSRAIETEWADMYQKFSRLAGRMDRTRAIESPPPAAVERPSAPALQSRSDILRRYKGR